MTTPKILRGMESQDADDLRKQLATSSEYYSSREFPLAFYSLATPPIAEKNISTYLEVLLTFKIYDLC